ncbi:MAG TPA: bifunctional DNA primase/polymerase [Bryobacteraceae bacterium]|jgi:hypothetical protein|nr:bifunctional DNA primase/polymerase [Bryobacteraceae bacterium]
MFLDIALRNAARGWHVFPCWPKTKKPLIDGGEKWANASDDEAQVRAWWTKWPEANVAVAGNGSGIAVLDVDHGLTDLAAWRAWCERNGIPETYAVRTGRRPEFGAQMYFAGRMDDMGVFHLDGCSGQVKSMGGYVMAAGCIHPDSGERYELLCDAPLAPIPEIVRQLRRPAAAPTNNSNVPWSKWSLPVHAGEDRTSFLMEQTGALRNLGCGKDSIRARMVELNEDPEIIADPVDDERLDSTAANCAKFPVSDPGPAVTIGGSKPEEKKITDWRERYLTFEQVQDAKPVEFLIDGFLALDSITAIAAPVGQRKSLIALNVAHALCTGQPLFDYFKVVKQPSRVIYLCPEMGISSFSMRLKQIGLASHVGQTLFCQTMDVESIKLTDLGDELPGSVVIVDTLTRFVDGDQNSSGDMSQFAKVVFGVQRRGATVVLLHHSIKGTSNSTALTLDSAMRGSTELAAFVTCCWATRLQDPDEPYNSPSLLANVKQRDFESKPFEATSDKTCRMHIVGEPGQMTEIKEKADDDAKAALALILKECPKAGINKLRTELKAAGHNKGVKWVTKARAAILGTGVTASA